MNFVPKEKVIQASATAKHQPKIVAIGISAGGPEALLKLLPALPGSFPVPILIVQHMPPLFTKILAERLNEKSVIRVVEGRDRMPIEPGVAYIAPGDYHMTVQLTGMKVGLAMNQGLPQHSCRPSADVLFQSVAAVYGKHAVGIIMTGMGQDGFIGLKRLKEEGALILAQDQASSLVWGMPSNVVQEGIADHVVPLHRLSGFLERLFF